MEILIASLFALGAIALLFVAASLLTSVLGGAQFVRTPARLFPQILELANLTPGELFVEPGCGTGQLLEYVARHSGAKAQGIELSPLLYLRTAWRAHRNPGMSVKCRHLLRADYRQANVVYCYLLPGVLRKLCTVLEQQLPRGAILISYAFPIPSKEATQVIPRTTDFAPIHIYRF